jgi:hypothetical protein
MAARAIQIEALLVGFSNAAGVPYSGGSVTVYDEGTLNEADIYTDAAMGTPASNPITLDTYGSVANPIFCNSNVKLVLKDSLGNTIKTWDELTYTTGNLFEEHSSAGAHIVQPVAFSVHRNAVNQIIPTSVATKIEWTTKEYDTNTDFDNAVNYRLTPTVAGKYALTAVAGWSSLPSQAEIRLDIYRNGVLYKQVTTKATQTEQGTPRIVVDDTHVQLSDSNPIAFKDGSGYTRATLADDADDYAYIPLVLPIGVTITKLEVWGYTEATPNGTVVVQMERRAVAGLSWDTMASVTLINTASTGEDTTISNAVVSEGYAYHLWLKIKASAGGAGVDKSRFYSARISYTTDFGTQSHATHVVVDANGTTDYFEVFVTQDSGSNQTIFGTISRTFFMGHRIGFS